MQIKIPGSKSISNRALLLASLAKGTSVLNNLQISDDILAIVGALRALGIPIDLDKQNHTARVAGCQGSFPNRSAKIDCHESGTLVRFMLTACAGMPGGTYHFGGGPSLRKRPLSSQIKTLTQMGVKFSSDALPLILKSQQPLTGGEITVDGSQTGQHISALLIMAPFMQQPLRLKAENLVSRPYVDMTCKMMQEFGVKVVCDEYWVVLQPQYYQAREYQIEADWSTASYFLAAAAVTTCKITIENISAKNSKQGDAIIVSLLKQMGCTVIENDNTVTAVGPEQLQGITVDMRDSPDIFMTVAAIAPFASSPTYITGITHARHKESDRIAAMAQGLKQLGAKIEEEQDAIRIFPSSLKGELIDTQNDHRIAMAFSVIGLKVANIELSDKECIAKSCPEFFKLWKQLWG